MAQSALFLEDKLIEATFAMVERWLMTAWQTYFPDDERLNVVTVRSADDLRSTAEALDAQMNQGTPRPSSGIKYPYANLIVTNISPNLEMGAFRMKNIPIVTARTHSSDQVTISNVIPVNIGMGFSMRTDNLHHVIRMSMILMFSAPKINLILQSEESGFTYSIMLNIDPELTIPQADMGHPAKEYRFDSSIIATTYMQRSRTQGVIRNIIFGIADTTGRQMSDAMENFESLDVLLNTRLKYTDIVDSAATNYRRT